MTLNISPQIEARLFDFARQEGIEPAALVEKLVQAYRPAKQTAPVYTIETVSSAATTEMVRAKLRQWQEETKTETSPAISAHELFARWAEEDAQMTDEEKEAEDRLWQDVEKGINESRSALGTR